MGIKSVTKWVLEELGKAIIQIVIAALMTGGTIIALFQYGNRLLFLVGHTLPNWSFAIVLGFAIWGWYLSLRSYRKRHKKVSIVLYPGQCRFHPGSVSGEPATQIMIAGFVTNNLAKDLMISHVLLKKPKRRSKPWPLTLRLEPNVPAAIGGLIFAQPPLGNPGDKVKIAIALVDQDSDAHTSHPIELQITGATPQPAHAMAKPK
jgi:hypothetical protein